MAGSVQFDSSSRLSYHRELLGLSQSMLGIPVPSELVFRIWTTEFGNALKHCFENAFRAHLFVQIQNSLWHAYYEQANTQDEGVLVHGIAWVLTHSLSNILPIRIGHEEILATKKKTSISSASWLLKYRPGHWGTEEIADYWREKTAGGNRLGSLEATL